MKRDLSISGKYPHANPLSNHGSDASSLFCGCGQIIRDIQSNGSSYIAESISCCESELLLNEAGCGLEPFADLIPALTALGQQCHSVLVVKSGHLA